MFNLVRTSHCPVFTICTLKFQLRVRPLHVSFSVHLQQSPRQPRQPALPGEAARVNPQSPIPGPQDQIFSRKLFLTQANCIQRQKRTTKCTILPLAPEMIHKPSTPFLTWGLPWSRTVGSELPLQLPRGQGEWPGLWGGERGGETHQER